MGANNGKGPAARSLYRQLRITCTQETSGRVTYSIYAKGLNDEWKQQHCLVRDMLVIPPVSLRSTEDVLGVLYEVLREQVLPSTDPP